MEDRNCNILISLPVTGNFDNGFREQPSGNRTVRAFLAHFLTPPSYMTPLSNRWSLRLTNITPGFLASVISCSVCLWLLGRRLAAVAPAAPASRSGGRAARTAPAPAPAPPRRPVGGISRRAPWSLIGNVWRRRRGGIPGVSVRDSPDLVWWRLNDAYETTETQTGHRDR